MYEEDEEEYEEEDKEMKKKMILVPNHTIYPLVPQMSHQFFIKLTIIFNIRDQID
jgi:hypothetical protein